MYSQQFNAIFVHIPKTAGQSIETVFLERQGLSWPGRAALLMRTNHDPARGPRKLAHLYAREYLECGHVPESVFAAAFKFTVVRNPFDRFLSLYGYRARKWQASFPQFVGWLAHSEGAPDQFERFAAPQSAFVQDRDGTILVDRILRYEGLDQEFQDVTQRLFGQAVPLPHRNKSRLRGERPDIDAETATRIYRHYEADFDLFRYPSTPGAS